MWAKVLVDGSEDYPLFSARQEHHHIRSIPDMSFQAERIKYGKK